MLALLMVPLAAIAYTITFALMYQEFTRSREEASFLTAGATTFVFVALYWILLWRRTVRWTVDRLVLTLGAVGGAMIPAGVLGAIGRVVDDDFGLFVGTVVWILVWLVMTVFIWRESAEERAARVSAGGENTLVCPSCGYNMTGLQSAVCPECGSRYSITELLAAQPHHEQAEIEPSSSSTAA